MGTDPIQVSNNLNLYRAGQAPCIGQVKSILFILTWVLMTWCIAVQLLHLLLLVVLELCLGS